jgi:pimeloyl-ACP methyl ester carboxylesterase
MSELGILFLPSGPGLSSGPAREFLEPILPKYGKTVFWDEPSANRDEPPAEDPLALCDQIFESLSRAASSLPDRFVILTESFGSILAEAFYARIVQAGRLRSGQKLVGILHTPPVLDLDGSLRHVVKLGAEGLERAGNPAAGRIREILASKAPIDSAEFGEALDLAFTSPDLLPRYFVSTESFAKWANGFSNPRFQPDPVARTKVLRALVAAKLPRMTTFAPDVPTWVFGGAGDPYRAVKDFEEVVVAARQAKRKDSIEWTAFERSNHYPFVDEPVRWKEAFERFLQATREADRA